MSINSVICCLVWFICPVHLPCLSPPVLHVHVYYPSCFLCITYSITRLHRNISNHKVLSSLLKLHRYMYIHVYMHSCFNTASYNVPTWYKQQAEASACSFWNSGSTLWILISLLFFCLCNIFLSNMCIYRYIHLHVRTTVNSHTSLFWGHSSLPPSDQVEVTVVLRNLVHRQPSSLQGENPPIWSN